MIESLDQYKAGEEELKALLASFAGSGDLVDKAGMAEEGDWKETAQKVSALKEELNAYREAHPQEFTN